MNHLPTASAPQAALCVDMGTTNTRVWLTQNGEILARAQALAGVRDTAREGSTAAIRSALRGLIQEVLEKARSRDPRVNPRHLLAAGMITSPLGLSEVPHLPAPAGLEEIARGIRQFTFPDICEYPVLLVPGVRCGPAKTGPENILDRDVMRGEETFCLGLLAGKLASPPAVVLNLGSHWKAIQIDSRGKIASSITSLSGELIHAAQTQTILASGLPAGRPSALDLEWCERGMTEQRRSGLPRALFTVRLLELDRSTSPEQRFSFLMGCFVAADLDALEKRGLFSEQRSVVLAGSEAVSEAWRWALEERGRPSVRLADEEMERALLAGLQAVVQLHASGCP